MYGGRAGRGRRGAQIGIASREYRELIASVLRDGPPDLAGPSKQSEATLELASSSASTTSAIEGDLEFAREPRAPLDRSLRPNTKAFGINQRGNQHLAS